MKKKNLKKVHSKRWGKNRSFIMGPYLFFETFLKVGECPEAPLL
jgi:hypothetical protein